MREMLERLLVVIGENMIFFKRQEDRQNGEYKTRKKSRGQIEKTFRPGASSVAEDREWQSWRLDK